VQNLHTGMLRLPFVADIELRRRIVGQDDAVGQIVNIYQTFLAGMSSPRRPIGNFLFLGPTGSGKTRRVEATAQSLVGDLRGVIKIECAMRCGIFILLLSTVTRDQARRSRDK